MVENIGLLIYSHSKEALDFLEEKIQGKKYRTSCFHGTKLGSEIKKILDSGINIAYGARSSLLSSLVKQHEAEIIEPALKNGYIVLQYIDAKEYFNWTYLPDIIIEEDLFFLVSAKDHLNKDVVKSIVAELEKLKLLKGE